MICKIPRVIALAYLSFSLTCCVGENADPLLGDIPLIATHFGTKGRYEEVNTYLINDPLAVNETLIRLPSSECSAIHLLTVIRHGTRDPTNKNAKKMTDFYNLVLSNASNWLQKVGLSQWKMWYTEDMDGRLVEKGRMDHTNLAMRLAKSFPTLVTEHNLRNGHIKFVTSSTHRCINSTIAFQRGLKKSFGIEGRPLCEIYTFCETDWHINCVTCCLINKYSNQRYVTQESAGVGLRLLLQRIPSSCFVNSLF